MRPGVAFYAGFFPRYNRLMAESGFAEAAQAGATRAVPDALIAATGVVGTAAECRARLGPIATQA